MSHKLSKKVRKETRKIMGNVGKMTLEMYEQASTLSFKKRLILAYRLLVGQKDWSRQ